MRRRPPITTWLAILIIAVLSLLAAIAPAQSVTSTSTATVEIVSPPVMKDFTLNAGDAYTLNYTPTAYTRTVLQGTGTVSPWSGAFFYDVRGKTFNAVVINKLSDLTKNNKLAGFELDAFAGTTVDKNGKAVAGFALGKTWKWFDQISFYTGVGISFSASTPIGGGVIVGAAIKF